MPLGSFVSNLFGLKKKNSDSPEEDSNQTKGEDMEEEMEVDVSDSETSTSNPVIPSSSSTEINDEEQNTTEDSERDLINDESSTASTIVEDDDTVTGDNIFREDIKKDDVEEVGSVIDDEDDTSKLLTEGEQEILADKLISSESAESDGPSEEIVNISAVDVLEVGGEKILAHGEEVMELQDVMEVVETEVVDEGDILSENVAEQHIEPGIGADVEVEEKEFGDENDNDNEAFVEITRRRVSQDGNGNCYCGKERNFNIAELLCGSCNRWYHESCIGYQLGKLVPFMTNYVFICKNCSPTGLESFKRNQAQFTQMCVTALANLTQASAKEGTHRKLFSKDKDIIPFFDMHWEGMTTIARKTSQSWHSTVFKALQKDVGTIYVCGEQPNDSDGPSFGLLSSDLSTISPNYDAMIKGGHLKVTELGVHQSSNSIFRGRGAKRRTVGDSMALSQASVAKKTRGDSFLPKMTPGHGYPVDHPYNKDGYRYILAEPDSNAPFRQEFDESSDWAGKPIPGWLYRVLNPCTVLLALHDRAPQLKVFEDRLSVTGEKGYCMIRATHGVTRGTWYWEAKIAEQPEGSHTRIGMSQPYANLQGPLGYDRFGYSWRSRYGTKFHEAKGKSYCKGGYSQGDILGFLIEMPDTNPNTPSVPSSFKDRPLVRFKSHLYYEDKQDSALEAEQLTKRVGSKITCFKNGVCQGVAFEDIYDGTYYPAVSLFKNVTVSVNFGPDFWSEPDVNVYPHKGMYERAEEAIVQQTAADLLFLTENDGKLLLDNVVTLPV